MEYKILKFTGMVELEARAYIAYIEVEETRKILLGLSITDRRPRKIMCKIATKTSKVDQLIQGVINCPGVWPHHNWFFYDTGEEIKSCTLNNLEMVYVLTNDVPTL